METTESKKVGGKYMGNRPIRPVNGFRHRTKGSDMPWVSDIDSDGIRHVVLDPSINVLGRQPIVFIVGALRAETRIKQEVNILLARRLAKRYWLDGWAVICPHLNGGCFEDECRGHQVAGHRTLLAKCDLVAVVKNKMLEKSSGSRGEMELADSLGIPVVFEEVSL